MHYATAFWWSKQPSVQHLLTAARHVCKEHAYVLRIVRRSLEGLIEKGIDCQHELAQTWIIPRFDLDRSDNMPSFSIEVPGEANPLTEGQLVQTLRSAASSNPGQIQTGTKQLQQWEKTPGYYRNLQSAFIDHQLPVEIRYLAIIQLKNGIDKYWRKTATR